MGEYDWNEEKNKELRKKRGIDFDDVMKAIEEGDTLDLVEHPNKIRYPRQKMLYVVISNYAVAVPFVERGNKRFLKTLYRSRVATKKYLREGKI